MTLCFLAIKSLRCAEYLSHHWRSFATHAVLSGLLLVLLAGCSSISMPHLIFESPQDSEGEQWRAYRQATEISHLENEPAGWFKVYIQASSLTQEERQARLVALNSVIDQPDQNQTFVALEQATLLGVSDAPRKQWMQAAQVLSGVAELAPGTDAELYRSWLQKELELRLAKAAEIVLLAKKNAMQAAQIRRLQNDVDLLSKRIGSLNEQINALTNIEQNLTEK